MKWQRWFGVVGLWSGLILASDGVQAEPPKKDAPKADAPRVDEAAVEKAWEINTQAHELIKVDKYSEAIPLAERSVEQWEKANGPIDDRFAHLVATLAFLHLATEDYARAEPLYERELSILVKIKGPGHLDIAMPVVALADLRRARGDYAQAELRYQQGLSILEQVQGPAHPQATSVRRSLIGMYKEQRDFKRAESLYLREVAVQEKANGPLHLDVATALLSLADFYFTTQGDYAHAEAQYQRALAIQEKALGAMDPTVATTIHMLAEFYRAKADYVRAEPLYQRALAIVEKALGPTDPNVVAELNGLAAVYMAKGEYARVEPLLQRALKILEKTLAPTDPGLCTTLGNLAMLYQTQGDNARAEALMLRALSIQENALGPTHLDLTPTLSNLASLYLERGDTAKAESLYLRVFSMQQNALEPPNYEDVVNTLTGLALVYLQKNDLVRAVPLLEKVLSIRKETLGAAHPEFATALVQVAMLYAQRGEFMRAEPLLQQALSIQESALGPAHPTLAMTLIWLGHVQWKKADSAAAEQLYRRALTIQEKALGSAHPGVGTILILIGGLCLLKRDLACTEDHFQRALAIFEKSHGPTDQTMVEPLIHVALLRRMQGDAARAEPLLQRALAISEQSLGRLHSEVAHTLQALALLHWSKHEMAPAREYLERSLSVADQNIVQALAIGSDEQRRAAIAKFDGDAKFAISLHVQYAPNDDQARDLALRTILRRKALVLDAMTSTFNAARDRLTPAAQVKYDAWRAVSAQYSMSSRNGPGNSSLADHRHELATLNEQRQKLENELSLQNHVQLEPVTIEQIQSKLPTGSALVEFFRYTPFKPLNTPELARNGPARFVAYVLGPKGKPSFVDLGEAAPLEEDVKAFQRALSRSATDPKPAARRLYQRVMAPIQKLLGNARHVYLSTDGALSLIPFHALMDDDDHYLIESLAITYVTTGRELIRPIRPTAPSPPAIFTAPDYDAGTSKGSTTRHFTAFRHGAEEGRVVAAQLTKPDVFDGPRATESALKSLRGPVLLHISTHGYFDKDRHVVQLEPGIDRVLPEQSVFLMENPLLRSGLGFAGANQGGLDQEDGVLTALEASQLNLWGTQLVVLSACETGLGEADNGDGVYGLRRAFIMAGAETLVMSLWKVDADATRNLMRAYYQYLALGEGKSEAMRKAQRELLADPTYAHPYSWASFIVSGDDSPMFETSRKSTFAQVRPGLRGCACEWVGAGASDSSMRSHAGFLGLMAGVMLAQRRRRSAPGEGEQFRDPMHVTNSTPPLKMR